jgi:hypothetical protein
MDTDGMKMETGRMPILRFTTRALMGRFKHRFFPRKNLR